MEIHLEVILYNEHLIIWKPIFVCCGVRARRGWCRASTFNKTTLRASKSWFKIIDDAKFVLPDTLTTCHLSGKHFHTYDAVVAEVQG